MSLGVGIRRRNLVRNINWNQKKKWEKKDKTATFDREPLIITRTASFEGWWLIVGFQRRRFGDG